MEASHPSFEIRPGEAIGPFALGMTRDEARALARGEFQAEARAWEASAPERADFFPDLGIVISYDANGRCADVEGQFGYAFGDKSGFLLFGKRINWMPADDVVELCKEHWADVTFSHYWYEVLSAGIRMTYFDSPLDGTFCAASVFPVARGR